MKKITFASSILVINTLVYGQAGLGVAALGGTVRDESNQVVAGARITITEESKRLLRQSESNSAGSFFFPALIAGIYSVRVEKECFSTEEMHGLRIDVGDQVALDIDLHVGQVQTAITVTAPATAELDGEANTIGSVVDSRRVRQLPLNGRYLLELTELTAGAVEVSPSSNLFASNVGPPERTIVLPGTLPNSVSYSLDGIDITGSRDGELALSPSVAGIDQFKVQENFVMPDQGVSPAGVNFVTKGGGNRLHGEAFEYFRNGNLNARSFFATGPEDLKRNQFGFAVGGPIRKDRAWFYAFYEGLRELTAFSTSRYSPIQEMFEGNFAGTSHVIYNPLAYDSLSGTREPFPNNVIPQSQINPVARNLLKYYLPGSSLLRIPSNVQGNPRRTLNDDQGGLRLDAALNTRHQLFTQIFGQTAPTDQPGLYPLTGLLYLNESQLAVLQDVWTVNPRAVNTLRIGYLRNTAIGGNEGQKLGPILSSVGILNTFEQDGITSINLQGYSSFGRSNGEVGNRDNTWQFNEEFAIVSGRHNLALGGQVRYRRGWQLNGNSAALGSLFFQPTFSAQLMRDSSGHMVPVPNTGDALADFLLGYPVNGMLTGLPVVQYRSTEFLPFFQDNWRLTPSLTLNYGMSWLLDPFPRPQEGWARNTVHAFTGSTGLLSYAALGQMSSQAVRTDWNDFAPRLGLAWKPASLRATVIRAGAGLYYSSVPWFLAPYPLEGGSPVGAGTGFTNSLTEPLPIYVMGLNIFPPAPNGGLTASYAANLPPGSVVAALNPSFRTAYVGQWNFSVQHSISRSDSIEFDYLGSSGHKLPNVFDLSQCRLSSNLYCSADARPWPKYALILYGDSSGNSSYEAFMAKFEHRVASGLNFRLEYTFAKALTDSYQASLSAYNQISDCRACSKGPATFDVRQRAVASLVWEMPFGRKQRLGRGMLRWADLAAGGWTLTAITTFATGQPVMLSAPNQTGSAFINPLPNRVCDGESDQFSDNIRNNGLLWFKTSCFTVPQVGHFGNSGPTVLSGPGEDNWDIAAEKSFPLPREASTLQLRAEMFNAWNHAQFEQPNGNAGAGANFGRISATGQPRLVQVAAKIVW